MRRRMSGRTWRWLAGLLIALLVPPVLAIGLLLLRAHQTLQVSRAVGDQLGFEAETPVRNGEEVFLLARVRPGSVMWRAGFRPGDRVLYRSTDCLYRDLVMGQGRDVPAPIERAGRRLELAVRVPGLNLPVDARRLSWYCPDRARAKDR